MNRNIGTTERWARTVAGLILLSLIYFIDGNWRWVGLIGIMPLVTAVIGWCPVYALFGINTCKNQAWQWPTKTGAGSRVVLKKMTEHGNQR